MKAYIMSNDNDGEIVIKLTGETPEENMDILLAAQQVKKPIESRGRITTSGVCAWFRLHKNKKITDWDATKIGNSE